MVKEHWIFGQFISRFILCTTRWWSWPGLCCVGGYYRRGTVSEFYCSWTRFLEKEISVVLICNKRAYEGFEALGNVITRVHERTGSEHVELERLQRSTDCNQENAISYRMVFACTWMWYRGKFRKIKAWKRWATARIFCDWSALMLWQHFFVLVKKLHSRLGYM